MNSIWIPALLALMCFGYGAYLLIFKDPKAVRRHGDTSLLKDPDKYVKNAAALLFFMGLGCVVMVLILYYTGNDTIATIESLSWLVIFAILWKKNENTNGAL